jgi:hypothetical protein
MAIISNKLIIYLSNGYMFYVLLLLLFKETGNYVGIQVRLIKHIHIL